MSTAELAHEIYRRYVPQVAAGDVWAVLLTLEDLGYRLIKSEPDQNEKGKQ